jgi:hypothetical protein
LNQDNVVVDGRHRVRACKELGFPVTFNVNFRGKPMEELRYVAAAGNLYRRHLDEFQNAEIGLKMEKISMQIALAKRQATAFTSETARDAANKRWNPGLTKNDGAIMPSASRDAKGIEPEAEGEEILMSRAWSRSRRLSLYYRPSKDNPGGRK